MSQTTSSDESMAHETVDRMTQTAQCADDEIRAAATKVVDAARVLQQRAMEAGSRVRSYAETNPLTTAGIAFAAGVLLSALIRR
jgi:ElaB/YqjD/DUF883 family membrane-anchored ribosome-binding protein